MYNFIALTFLLNKDIMQLIEISGRLNIMKKTLMFILMVIVVFTSGCAKQNLQTNTDDISTEDLNDIPTERNANNYWDDMDENFSSYDEDFDKIIKDNPIDKAMFLEEENYASTTVDMHHFAEKYGDIWEKEMNKVYEELKKSLEGDARKALIESQESWEKYYKKELSLLYEMYMNTSGEGSIIPLAISYKAVSFERDRTIKLARYYYVLTGNFQFEFKGT